LTIALVSLIIALTKKAKCGKIYFNSWFKKFQSIVLGFVDSGTMVIQSIMVAGTCGGGDCLPHGGEEAEKVRK
jgi:hypothetical protein